MRAVRKAVITAAGLGTRHFPATRALPKEMMPLVDRDGHTKPTLQIIVEEALAAGIEEVCLVVSPESEGPIRAHFGGAGGVGMPAGWEAKPWLAAAVGRLAELGRRIRYVRQERPEGYGHAVHCAREFAGDAPFLLLLGDHVYLSATEVPCARQLIEVFERHGGPLSSVQRTPGDLLHLYGTLAGRRLPGTAAVYEVTRIREKPTLAEAEARLRVPGLEPGQYLCFFGSHVLPPALFDCLEYQIRRDLRERGEIQLTSALDLLREQDRYFATEIDGIGYDMGVPFAYVQTQLALALNSPARRRVLASLPRLLATDDLDALR